VADAAVADAAATDQLGWHRKREAIMGMSRQQARIEHTSSTAVATGTGHDQFTETIYGVICSTCHNYISIDKTNCPSMCREHETCRQAYA
jgi:cytochrome c5